MKRDVKSLIWFVLECKGGSRDTISLTFLMLQLLLFYCVKSIFRMSRIYFDINSSTNQIHAENLCKETKVTFRYQQPFGKVFPFHLKNKQTNKTAVIWHCCESDLQGHKQQNMWLMLEQING